MFSIFRHSVLVLLVIVMPLAVGCGGGGYQPAAESNPDHARQTLTGVLEAWKDGKTSSELAAQSPKVFVGDEDWSGGQVLKNYELIGDAEPHGSSVRFQVGLQLAAKSGEPVQKTARYLVATDPVLSVTRDDRVE
jgi:hypothetical protein